MKSLVLKSILIFIFLSSSLYAGKPSCQKTWSELIASKEAVLLEDDQVVWGNYICSSCGNESSMKPNRHGAVHCGDDDHGCGVAHSREADFPPAFFKVKGEVYLMNRKALVDYDTDGRYQGHGARRDCPYCGSDHFNNMGSCTSCGAEVVDFHSLLQDLPTAANKTETAESSDLRSSTSSTAIASASLSPKPPKPVTGEDLSQQRGLNEETRPETVSTPQGEKIDNEKVVQTIQLSRNQMIAIGAGGSVLGITGGAITYHRSKETFVVTAKVTDISDDQIWFSYNFEGKTVRDTLSYDSGKAIAWRIGEEFEVHLLRWQRRALGAERGNGEVYPIQD